MLMASLDLPAEFSGRLVEPGADSPLPVFVKVGVQDHAIPAGGHGCLFPILKK